MGPRVCYTQRCSSRFADTRSANWFGQAVLGRKRRQYFVAPSLFFAQVVATICASCGPVFLSRVSLANEAEKFGDLAAAEEMVKGEIDDKTGRYRHQQKQQPGTKQPAQ